MVSDHLDFYFRHHLFNVISCFLLVIGSGPCQTWEQLFVCRLLLCLGMDVRAPAVLIFAAENVPVRFEVARDELTDVCRFQYLPRSDLAL